MVINKTVTCYDPSDNSVIVAVFFPVGFCTERNGELAHLTEHCLLELIRRDFLPDRLHKPYFLLFNAMTTSYYTCIWFSSPKSCYETHREVFIGAIEQLGESIIKLDEAAVNREKNKIINELHFLKHQFCLEGRTVSDGLLEEQGLNDISIEEVRSVLNKYVAEGGILFEYGDIECFDETTYEIQNNCVEFVLLDDHRLLIRNATDPTLVNWGRLISHIACQKKVAVHFRQLTSNSMYIGSDETIKNVMSALESIDDKQLQYYIEEYYMHERVKCSDNLEFLKRLYKYYRQTGKICNKKTWYESIYNLPETYKEIITYVRNNYD